MTQEPTVRDMMEAYALDAVDHARSALGIELDFSPGSVRLVERVLKTMHDETKPKGLLGKLFSKGPSPEQLDVFTKMYGGYVGEVLRREAGGEWFLDTEVMPGNRVIGLKKDDRRIWPPAKVGKRLMNGDEDNVWVYFQVILKEKW